MGIVDREGAGIPRLPPLALGGTLSLLGEEACDRWDVNNHSWNMAWLCWGPVFSFLAACFGKRSLRD